VFQELERKVPTGADPHDPQLHINRNSRTVFISNNIFDADRFNIIVEFKPKSVLPDVYSNHMIAKVAHLLQISEEELKKAIQSSEPMEKLRWFKKTLMSSKRSNVKLNENPLNIFRVGHSGGCSPINLLGTKTRKQLPVLT
jgi:hypothetical protein